MPYNEDLVRRMRTHLAQVPGLTEKKMFGGVGFLIDGNMACGVHRQDLIVRVGPERYAQALTQPWVGVFDMTGRPMKGWITVAPAGYAAEEDLCAWVQQGGEFAQSLPAK